MRCLLLAVTVALACGAQGIYVPQTRVNLDVRKVAGAWHPMAMVASDTASQNTQSAPLRLYIKELRPTAHDGLEITVRRWEDGSCVERKMFAERTEAPASFHIDNQEEGNAAPIPDQKDGNMAPVPDQKKDNAAPVPDQEEGNAAPVPDQEEGNAAPVPDQKKDNMAPVPDQKKDNAAPVPDQEEGNAAPVPDQEEGNAAPVPDQKDDNMAPVPDQKKDNMAPVPDQKKDNSAPVSDQKKDNSAPAAALEGGKVHVLDTDYENFLFLCMEAATNAAAGAAPARRSLACQYLARSPKADRAVMEHFNRAVKLFSMDTSVPFSPTQAEERCRV